MRKTIPLIRSAAIVPILKWLIARNRPVEDMLRAANIGYVWIEDPFAPLPIHAMEQLLLALIATEPPDFACLATGPDSLTDVSAIGAIATQTRTPREAFALISAAMPFHCSHELISLTAGPEVSVIHDYWNLSLDPTVQHVIHLVVTRLFQYMLEETGAARPHFIRIEITPHPEHGISHLRPWFDCEIVAAPGRLLSITIPTELADQPFPNAPKEQMVWNFPWTKLSDGTMVGSARLMIRHMLQDHAPTIAELSAVGGISVRSLQRRLDEEGTSFSMLLDDERRHAALNALQKPKTMIGEAAAQAGYAKQSSLTRAMRRWTGQAPTDHRNLTADKRQSRG